MAAKTKPSAKGTKKPAKKTAAKTAPATKKPTKAPAKKVAAKKTTAKKTKNVTPPAKIAKEPTYRRIPNERTGFSVGTDQDIIAEALLEGGESREDIIAALSDRLEGETRNGTPKPISSLVSSVLRKLLERGYTVEQYFIVHPPVAKAGRKKRAA